MYSDFVIQELNRRIAKAIGQEAKEVNVTFVPLIKREESFKDGQLATKEVLGQCNTQTGEIRIVPKDNWGRTLIEELVHLYRPELRHPQVRALVRQCVAYLKANVGEHNISTNV